MELITILDLIVLVDNVGFRTVVVDNADICLIPLGCELEVPTLDGKVKYKIPEGTQTGSVFRLKGKGIPYIRGSGRGDQFVTVRVETPRNLTSEQKELLEKLGESFGHKAEKSGFFDKKKKKK